MFENKIVELNINPNYKDILDKYYISTKLPRNDLAKE